VEHRTVRCMVRPTSYSREFQPTSAIIYWTVRVERQTVRCASYPMASCHVGRGPMITWCTGRSGVPQNRKPANHAILCRCTVHCPVHPWIEGNQILSNGALTVSVLVTRPQTTGLPSWCFWAGRHHWSWLNGSCGGMTGEIHKLIWVRAAWEA
jgi:hypothetical protein